MIGEWINIFTALPTLETFVIVWANKSVFIFYYGIDNNDKPCFWYDDEPVKLYMSPTHWMELPEKPSL